MRCLSADLDQSGFASRATESKLAATKASPAQQKASQPQQKANPAKQKANPSLYLFNGLASMGR
jgi:hypothetical protein